MNRTYWKFFPCFSDHYCKFYPHRINLMTRPMSLVFSIFCSLLSLCLKQRDAPNVPGVSKPASASEQPALQSCFLASTSSQLSLSPAQNSSFHWSPSTWSLSHSQPASVTLKSAFSLTCNEGCPRVSPPSSCLQCRAVLEIRCCSFVSIHTYICI